MLVTIKRDTLMMVIFNRTIGMLIYDNHVIIIMFIRTLSNVTFFIISRNIMVDAFMCKCKYQMILLTGEGLSTVVYQSK